MLNDSIRYVDGELYCDDVAVRAIAEQTETPVYIYSLKRVLANYRRIEQAFAPLGAHIHYSAKANGNMALLRALVGAGAGIDCVSGGEVFRALAVGCAARDIVFAGVGKTTKELRYAVEKGVGWVNIENVDECRLLNDLAVAAGRTMRVALRYNPDVAANTIKQIATGHGGAKFGLPADAIQHLLDNAADFPALRFEGIHVHIGSQLGDTSATEQAVLAARALAAPYATIRTLDIGGGLPVAYRAGDVLPDVTAFAAALKPLVEGFDVILEPGRSIVADAGLLVAQVLYIKRQGGQTFVILDAGMTELIRPALYEAWHEVLKVNSPPAQTLTPQSPLPQGEGGQEKNLTPQEEPHPPAPSPLRERGGDNAEGGLEVVEIVGPVCETTDVLAHARPMPPLAPGDLVAFLTAGAYGFVMASNYNARPRPPEVVVSEDGGSWRVDRAREGWEEI